jgi:ectoine hydroxylase-related dioxygenase (phytanoyl-CoA dioxygenase family)
MERDMNGRYERHEVRDRNWYRERECSLADLLHLVEGQDPPHLEFAADIRQRVPLYDCRALDTVLGNTARRLQLQAEWAEVLRNGAGVFVLRQAFADVGPIDEATTVFESIIREERDCGANGADHFAKAGANDRIWNAQEKLCLRAPAVFARYFCNRMLVAAAQAWLGPGYQMTSQVNVVRPGGEAQQAHRDYHLGFQTAEQAERYPAHVHWMSAFLTLQGAVAHTDMPVESGPTKLLPFSQRYVEGYLAWRRADFREYFEAHCVQLPLTKGDALFFNPALFHAAGTNRTQDVQRMANLLQISSAFGRAMETVDRAQMSAAVYPALCESRASGAMSEAEIDAVIASCAEGYSFPTNLDRDPPVGGLAPAGQQALLRQALNDGWPAEALIGALKEQIWRRSTYA